MEAKPYEEKSLGALEFINEIFLLLLFYMVPSFSPWITSVKANYYFGWIFVYGLGPFILINVGFVVVGAVTICCDDWKRMKY